MKEQHIQEFIQEFYAKFCPFKWADVERAIEYTIQAGLTIDWLIDEVISCIKCGSDLFDMDIVTVALSGILYNAHLITIYKDYEIYDYIEIEGKFSSATYILKKEFLEIKQDLISLENQVINFILKKIEE